MWTQTKKKRILVKDTKMEIRKADFCAELTNIQQTQVSMVDKRLSRTTLLD